MTVPLTLSMHVMEEHGLDQKWDKIDKVVWLYCTITNILICIQINKLNEKNPLRFRTLGTVLCCSEL